jgi:hypothetical protein
MMTSRRKNKIMFIITDGEFNRNPNDEIIQRMNTQGVTTVLLLISSSNEQQLASSASGYYGTDHDIWHQTKIHGIVNSAVDILPFAKQIVLDVIKKSSRR